MLSFKGIDKLSETIDVTSKHGQIYRCIIPSQMEAEKQKEEEEKIAMEAGVPELLKPMESGPCLFKVKSHSTIGSLLIINVFYCLKVKAFS